LLSIIEYTVTAIVCLISAIIIQRIFIKERKEGSGENAIRGIMWFGFAILAWGLGAVLNLILVFGLRWDPSNKIIIYLGVLVSLTNSLFILLSLPSIEHNKKKGIVVRLVQKFSTKDFIGVYFGVLLMIVFVFLATSINNMEISSSFIWLIDIPISVLVAFSLLYELNKAFSTRKMRFMYLPTFVLFVLIIIAVTHRIIPQDRAVQLIDQEFWSIAGSITAISFKFLFILLFSILLYSWKFLSEKEQQQGLADKLSTENIKLKKKLEQQELANESHMDTIKSMKNELVILREATKIDLSERQKEVLGNLAYFGTNKSYPEIAELMNISIDGFQTHIHQVKKLLNISGKGGKEQLIEYAKNNDLLQYSSLEGYA
jgi:DNA-binding CsgD family transcriptional regulator